MTSAAGSRNAERRRHGRRSLLLFFFGSRPAFAEPISWLEARKVRLRDSLVGPQELGARDAANEVCAVARRIELQEFLTRQLTLLLLFMGPGALFFSPSIFVPRFSSKRASARAPDTNKRFFLVWLAVLLRCPI